MGVSIAERGLKWKSPPDCPVWLIKRKLLQQICSEGRAQIKEKSCGEKCKEEIGLVGCQGWWHMRVEGLGLLSDGTGLLSMWWKDYYKRTIMSSRGGWRSPKFQTFS